MKVLWFTNTPSLSAEYLNNKSIGGGWIESLESELIKISYIQLGISFNVSDQDFKKFQINKTIYYPLNIKSPKNKINKLITRWAKPIENKNDIQTYLDVIQDFKPDIIHIFGTESAFGLLASNTNIPCIIHLQGNLTIYNKKWHNALTPIDILKYSKKWDLVRGWGFYHDYLLNQKAAKRERSIFHHCNYFMGRTDWDRRITSILSPDSKYFHCDEMMRPVFYLQKWKPQENKNNYTIISTIRNNIYKGLETIHECKRILNKLNLDWKIQWKIAGISETDEITYLFERKYKSTFKEIEIQLLGPLGENDLVEIMLDSDLFIHPSHIDNSPNSLGEAMLLGMPLIATFAGGIPSIVEDKKEGLLIQDGDPYALAGAIIELKENTQFANDLGSNARIKAMTRHNPKTIINDLLKIYSSII